MRVGDLVKHNPSGSTHPAMTAIYRDWGHEPDFKVAIIIEAEGDFAKVLPSNSSKKPAWYKMIELEVISESR